MSKQSGPHGATSRQPKPTSFGSLADALKAHGLAGDTEEAAPTSPPGWSLNKVGGDMLSEAELAEIQTGSDRAQLRPNGFGPMESGPAQYRDVESEEMRILSSFGVRTIFPDDVKAEVALLPDAPNPADYENRRDLRSEQIFTIDGPDAHDFDDALSMAVLPNGNYLLGVHIADVSHYVRPRTAIDDEAHARATSVYLPDQVIPMLPEKLSNDLCSLVPDKDRLTKSVFMEYTPDGGLVDVSIGRSVIHSNFRCTYGDVQDLLDGRATPETERIKALTEPLQHLAKWTRVQQKLRDDRESMRIQSDEKKIRFDEKGKAVAIENAPRYFSQTLIEETALAANRAVGSFFHAEKLPMLYRVHAEKPDEEVRAIIEMLGEYGVKVPLKDRLTGRDVAGLILQARTKPNGSALIKRIMALVERAEYEFIADADKGGATHFGLASKDYLHFTSPIRRYNDLVVHRSLDLVLDRPKEAADLLKADDTAKEMGQIASHCSIRHELSDYTERALTDLKICEIAEAHINQVFLATVEEVSRPGIKIFVRELNLSGFIPMSSISGSFPKITGPNLEIQSGNRLLRFTEGRPTKIKFAAVDFDRLKVIFELA